MIEDAKQVAQRLRELTYVNLNGDTEAADTIDALVAEVERLGKVDVEPDKLDAMTKVIAELEKALGCNEYIERRQYSEPHTMAATVRGHINKAMDLLVIEAAKAGFAKALNPDPASALAALQAENETIKIGHESSRTSMLEMLAKHKEHAVEIKELRAQLAQAQAESNAAVADAGRLRKFVVKEFPNGWGDHACAECHPNSEIIKPGFRCIPHAARAALEGE